MLRYYWPASVTEIVRETDPRTLLTVNVKRRTRTWAESFTERWKVAVQRV